MADNISVFDIAKLLIAFEKMEGLPEYPDSPQAPWGNGSSSINQAISAFCNEATSAKSLPRDMQVERLDDNNTVGEAIYGRGGWTRYFLRADGYVYFSTYHTPEGEQGKKLIEKAKSLGFLLN